MPQPHWHRRLDVKRPTLLVTYAHTADVPAAMTLKPWVVPVKAD